MFLLHWVDISFILTAMDHVGHAILMWRTYGLSLRLPLFYTFLLKKCRSPVHVLVHPPTSTSSPLLRRHKFPPPFGLYHPLVVRWHSAEQLLLTDLVWGVVTVSIGRYWTIMNLTTKRWDSSVDLWISCRWFWCSRPRPHMAIFEHVVLSHCTVA